MEIATMCLRGLAAGHWAGLRRNGVAEPVMRDLAKNIGGMRFPDERAPRRRGKERFN